MSTPDDRRRATRHFTCLPAGVVTPKGGRVAIIKDASSTGALVLSPSRLAKGDRLTLNITPEGEEAVQVEGVIVRSDPVTEGVWSCEVAVKFEPERADLVEYFQELERKSKARGL